MDGLQKPIYLNFLLLFTVIAFYSISHTMWAQSAEQPAYIQFRRVRIPNLAESMVKQLRDKGIPAALSPEHDGTRLILIGPYRTESAFQQGLKDVESSWGSPAVTAEPYVQQDQGPSISDVETTDWLKEFYAQHNGAVGQIEQAGHIARVEFFADSLVFTIDSQVMAAYYSEMKIIQMNFRAGHHNEYGIGIFGLIRDCTKSSVSSEKDAIEKCTAERGNVYLWFNYDAEGTKENNQRVLDALTHLAHLHGAKLGENKLF